MYYGDGKGKSTAAMGLIVRAAGHGMKVMVFQFLKCAESGEIGIIKSLPQVTYVENTVDTPFLFNLTDEQKEYFEELYAEEFARLCEMIRTGGYDLVVLDEVIDAYELGLVPEEMLFDLLEHKPEGTELVITGHEYEKPVTGLWERSDYVTHFVKEKHPYDHGEPCRVGIEE